MTPAERAAWAEAVAQVDRCVCGVLVLRWWPKPHVCAPQGAPSAGERS